MPFAKSNRKGSRIIRTTLRNGYTRSVFKSFQPVTSNSSASITTIEETNNTSAIEDPLVQTEQFDIEEHDNVQFLLSGDIVKKKRCGGYERNKEKELHSWSSVTSNICENYAEKFNLLLLQKCTVCDSSFEEGLVWCKDCGPLATYCQGCADVSHKNIAFHNAITLKPNFDMMTYTFHNELHDAHCYSCSNKYFRVITIVSEKGCLHQCEVWFCTCESEFSKLLKYDLWPSTPTKPSTAISIKLLDQFVALQMEGKISFTSFIDGMSWKTGMHNQTLKRVLTRFMQTDSIDQYRQFQRQLRDLWFSDLTGKKPNQCPACPIDAGSVFYCMDANFGLVLKSSASKSKNTPNNDKNHFIEDDEVDTFMSSYDDKAVENKECNNFQAGNRIRSKRKSSKLSVTGVFGVSCRHEIPKLFLNMRHGERIGYAVLMMNKILAEVLGKDIDVHIMYDIACLLKKHLTKKGTLSKYPKFKLGIPVFHAYGHKSSCQVQHSIRRMEGFGLMDGELMERLWSYLRSFSKITKEMTSAHRVDFLSDALNHFTMTKLEILGKTLVGWYQKANAVYQTSSAEIQTLCLNLDNITDEVIHSWKLEEESKIKWKSVVEQEVGWEFKYYTKIKELNNENTLLLLSSSVSDTARHRIKLNRLESGLSSFEKKHDVNDRWSITSNQYTYHHRKFVQNAVKTTLDTLHTRATERLMLLTLKKRYADGSSICNRLSVQINKICNDLKNLVESLNQTNRECGVYEDVLYKDALDVNSRIYLNTTTVDQVNNTSHNIPASVKSTCVQFYLRKCRATEELQIVRTEMQHVLNYYREMESSLATAIYNNDSPKKIFVIEKLNYVRNTVENMQKLFMDVESNNLEDDFDVTVYCDGQSSDESDEENP